MNEIIMSWPMLDRAIFGAVLALFIYASFHVAAISAKLDRVIRLLEIANGKT